jgi:tRNA-guanine family transglycosylase
MLSAVLLTQHNLRFFHRCMEELRAAIERGGLEAMRERFERAQGRAE